MCGGKYRNYTYDSYIIVCILLTKLTFQIHKQYNITYVKKDENHELLNNNHVLITEEWEGLEPAQLVIRRVLYHLSYHPIYGGPCRTRTCDRTVMSRLL